jgi:hypothetical protein
MIVDPGGTGLAEPGGLKLRGAESCRREDRSRCSSFGLVAKLSHPSSKSRVSSPFSFCRGPKQRKPTMSADKPSPDKQAPISELRKRVSAEIQDNFDEDIELELEDEDLADLLSESAHLQLHDSLPRRLYFKELLRL